MRPRPVVLLVAVAVLLVPAGAGANVTVDTDQEPDSSVIQIDPSTKIVDMTWTSDGVTLIFQSQIPRRAMLTDVYSVAQAGASEVRFKRTQLTTGRTEVYMPATQRRGDQAVTIMVGTTMVSVSDPTKPFLTDVGPEHVIIGAASGALIILIVVYLLYRRKRSQAASTAIPMEEF